MKDRKHEAERWKYKFLNKKVSFLIKIWFVFKITSYCPSVLTGGDFSELSLDDIESPIQRLKQYFFVKNDA